MIIPIRCFTCGKVIGNKWDKWCQYAQEGVEVKERYKLLQLTRICCKTIFLTHENLIDILLEYRPLDKLIPDAVIPQSRVTNSIVSSQVGRVKPIKK